MPKLEILSEEERRFVETTPETGFIADFTEWAAKRTDAPLYSLHSAAMMALSLAAGDTVVLPGIFSSAPVHMNLYILIVGPSTIMRKTTVLNYVMDLVPKNAQTQQRYVKVLDDVSPQAFNKAAAEAGKTMSPVVLNMDEVAGVFQVSRRRNSYASGFESVLLKVYDHTPVTINRTGGDIEAPRGTFVNLFAASTPEPLMEVLDSDDIASGLLPRFIVFDARDATRGERRTLMERMAINEAWKVEQGVLAEFLYDIARDRANGVPTGTTPDGLVNYPVTELGIEHNALVRLDAIDRIFTGTVSDEDSAISAIKGRALWHIYKIAGLYALSREGRTATVALNDVLRAAHLVESTASDLLTMRDEVGANELERRIREVLEFIALRADNRQRQDLIANKFTLSATELRELGSTLIIRGLIQIEKDGDVQYWRRT